MKFGLKLAFGILFILLLTAVGLAIDVFSPSDSNYVNLKGNLTYQGNPFICTVQGSAIANVSNVTRWDNSTNIWKRNQTNTGTIDAGTTWQNVTFVPPRNFTDGFTFQWACEVCVNGTHFAGGDYCTNATWQKFSTNNTVTVEIPPNVTLEYPATNNKSRDKLNIINFTVSSNYISSGLNNNLMSCRLWENSSGNWTQGSLGINVLNSTANNTNAFPYTFSEGSTAWNVECAEFGRPYIKDMAQANFTIFVDATNPTISLFAPADGSTVINNTGGKVLFNFTPYDFNLDSCSLYHNASGSYIFNLTNKTSVVNGTPVLITQTIPDGNVVYAITCNDTLGRSVFSANSSFTIKTSGSLMVNITNYTVPNTCSQVGITWNTSEARNGSIIWSSNSSTVFGNADTASTSLSTVHYANLTFGNAKETLFYFAVKSCDAWGNCNSSNSNVTSPVGLCNEGGYNAGWSAYAILNNDSTLGIVANNSRASLAYFWNSTGQSWVFNQKGTVTNAGVPLPYGSAVLLYSATNSTWFRNVTGLTTYKINLTQGDNFVGLVRDYNFLNLTQSMLNASLGNSLTITAASFGDANLTNNTIFFASFNNTIHNYLSHYRSYFWENTTLIAKGDVVWTWVDRFNVSWNGTAIFTNQSLLS